MVPANGVEGDPDVDSTTTFFSSSRAISHAVVFKTETFILNTTKMWHRAQARHLFQQNVMFWSFSKMIFLFLKKVCGHGDESVNLKSTVCRVILKAENLKIHGKKIIFLKYYFNFILWLSIFFFLYLSIASNLLPGGRAGGRRRGAGSDLEGSYGVIIIQQSGLWEWLYSSA